MRAYSRLSFLHMVLRSTCAMLMSCIAISSHAATNFKVTLVLSDDNPIYQRFAKTYQDHLPAPYSATIRFGVDSYLAGPQTSDLIVTIGSKAASALMGRTSKPMLLTMLPSKKYAELASRHANHSQHSALFIDQPWSRHIELLFATLPQTRRVGLLSSPNSEIDIDALRKLVTQYDAQLVTRVVAEPGKLFSALEDTLNHSDVLLAIPDNEIYSSNNIRNILMTSYRHNTPLVGLSKGFVNAGALCAVYSTPEDQAMQASAMTLSFALSNSLPPPQYPIVFQVATNAEVARTLGIHLQPIEKLRLQLLRAEGRQ